MEGKGLKKKSYFSMNTIMKVYLPIVLTIFVVFNIPFIPNPIGLNTNLNFQPASASGESYFFDEAYFKKPNKNKKTNSNNHNGDLNIAIWIAFLIICTCLFSLAGKLNIDKNHFNLNVLFFAWIFVFTVFLSFITIKGCRYLIIAIPPIVYYLLWALEHIFYKIKDRNIFKIALILMIIILACYSLTYTFENTTLVDERNNTDIKNVYDYLIDYDSDYESKNLTSDYSYGSRFGTWILKKDVDYVKKRNLDISNSDYIISKRDMNLTNYTHIYNSGKIHLYQNIKYY